MMEVSTREKLIKDFEELIASRKKHIEFLESTLNDYKNGNISQKDFILFLSKSLSRI